MSKHFANVQTSVGKKMSRHSRRQVLKGASAFGLTTVMCRLLITDHIRAMAAQENGFREVVAGVDEKHRVADGYTAHVVLRWGDPIFADAPEFNPYAQSSEKQVRQFGYNNDFIGLVPLPNHQDTSEHALLVVNHEHTTEELMFPGMTVQEGYEAFAKMTPELVEIELMAHGGSIVEILKVGKKWQLIKASKYNRRITAKTEIEITGPAAGHDLLKTTVDRTGRRVQGMLNNCAGAITPWGTWLASEENFHNYFSIVVSEEGLPTIPPQDSHLEPKKYEETIKKREELLIARREQIVSGLPNGALLKRYGVPRNWHAWYKYYDRFDVIKEPNEPNRFGWVVEIDPYDSHSVPKKRTALGRIKHEGAENIVNRDGRVVVYMGDDDYFEYVYKFVTARTYDPNNRLANMGLLDEGTLHVARFDDSGKGEWLPLVHGVGKLTAENGFSDQASVLIKTRLAADAVGATKMDRPEDICPARNGNVYINLTNNTRRTNKQVDAANPRPNNKFGHIIRIRPANNDHTATSFTWDTVLKCGDPAIAEIGATFSTKTSKNGWFGMPDNCVIDTENRLWVATDGNSDKETGRTDGLWALTIDDNNMVTSKLFFRCPVGAELSGPYFTSDTRSLFVSVQHPGRKGEDWAKFGRASTFDDPSTRWPDFQSSMPPRLAVVVITKDDGGKIGA
jgi:secreted PhoX family phosphatase